jgi:hypothetical protein
MDSRMLGALAAAAVGLWAASTTAQTVVDGDTINLDGTKYRIWGIDAAETKQACADGWMAGKEASAAMVELTRGHAITCEAKAKYGRTVALCRADGQDLGAAMVERRHGLRIHPVERRLRGAGEGCHRLASRCACARLRKALGLARPEPGRPLTRRTMGEYPPRQPPPTYVSIPPAKVGEHRYRCPICHVVVDSCDLDAVARHLEPGHPAPSK